MIKIDSISAKDVHYKFTEGIDKKCPYCEKEITFPLKSFDGAIFIEKDALYGLNSPRVTFEASCPACEALIKLKGTVKVAIEINGCA